MSGGYPYQEDYYTAMVTAASNYADMSGQMPPHQALRPHRDSLSASATAATAGPAGAPHGRTNTFSSANSSTSTGSNPTYGNGGGGGESAMGPAMPRYGVYRTAGVQRLPTATSSSGLASMKRSSGASMTFAPASAPQNTSVQSTNTSVSTTTTTTTKTYTHNPYGAVLTTPISSKDTSMNVGNVTAGTANANSSMDSYQSFQATYSGDYAPASTNTSYPGYLGQTRTPYQSSQQRPASRPPPPQQQQQQQQQPPPQQHVPYTYQPPPHQPRQPVYAQGGQDGGPSMSVQPPHPRNVQQRQQRVPPPSLSYVSNNTSMSSFATSSMASQLTSPQHPGQVPPPLQHQMGSPYHHQQQQQQQPPLMLRPQQQQQQPVYAPMTPDGRSAAHISGNLTEQFISSIGSLAAIACTARGRHMLMWILRLQHLDKIDVIYQELAPRLSTVALDPQGCQVVRTLVEFISTEQLVALIPSFTPKTIIDMARTSQNTRRTLQAMFEYHSSPALTPVVAVIASESCGLATTQQGCIALMRIIEHGLPEQRRMLVDSLLPALSSLTMNPYGNYVVQCILDNAAGVPAPAAEGSEPGNKAVATPQTAEESHRTLLDICAAFEAHWVPLSCNKFASNVMEKVVRQMPAESRAGLLDELIFEPANLHCLMQDGFGNFVLQAIVSSETDPDVFGKVYPLVEGLVHSSPYGHKIEAKLRAKYTELFGKEPARSRPPAKEGRKQ